MRRGVGQSPPPIFRRNSGSCVVFCEPRQFERSPARSVISRRRSIATDFNDESERADDKQDKPHAPFVCNSRTARLAPLVSGN